jgi:hypothetical protein
MKKLFLLLITFVIPSFSFSQGCLPDGITFTTQEQIDNFQTDYPGCTVIEGDVAIDGHDISNLNGLSVLTSLEGSLFISQNDQLTSLSGLDNITSIRGFVDISWNDQLLSMDGLNQLDTISGGISFYANESMRNFNGLNNLVYIGDGFGVEWCDSLTSFDGLENLNTVSGYLNFSFNRLLNDLTALNNLTNIGGSLYICYNNTLNSLEGLGNVIIGGNISIYNNESLSDCNIESLCNNIGNPAGQISIYNNAAGCDNPREVADHCNIPFSCLPFGNYYVTSQADADNFQTNYPGCTELEGYLEINGDNITNLTGLLHLTSINGSLGIFSNDSLVNFTGLDSLVHIGGGFQVGYYEGNENTSLTDFTGLGNLQTIGGLFEVLLNDDLLSFNGLNSLTSTGGLSIAANEALITLAGLDSLKSISGFLDIIGNTSLSECDIQGICAYLAVPGGNIGIHGNATGCNSPEEVEAACEEVGVNEIPKENEFKIYPNPANDFLFIETSEFSGVNQLEIINASGLNVLNQTFSGNSGLIDLRHLPDGLYIIRIQGNISAMMVKFVKL